MFWKSVHEQFHLSSARLQQVPLSLKQDVKLGSEASFSLKCYDTLEENPHCSPAWLSMFKSVE